MFLCAPAMGADVLRLGEEYQSFETSGFDALYFDVSDGAFAPDFGASPSLISGAKKICSLPRIAHLMLMEPDRHIQRFLDAGCTGIILPVEAKIHIHRALSLIKAASAASGLSLLPATPLTKADYLLDFADYILLLRREPGSIEGVPQNETTERVRILKDYLGHRGLKARILVDAPDTMQDAAIFAHAGASGFVLRERQFFALEDFRRTVDARRLVMA